MKDQSLEFKKLIQICCLDQKAQELFVDFLGNDPNFEQTVDREGFM